MVLVQASRRDPKSRLLWVTPRAASGPGPEGVSRVRVRSVVPPPAATRARAARRFPSPGPGPRRDPSLPTCHALNPHGANGNPRAAKTRGLPVRLSRGMGAPQKGRLPWAGSDAARIARRTTREPRPPLARRRRAYAREFRSWGRRT